MDITDVKRLRGTPLGVVGAYSGPSGAPPVARVAPNRCPCAVLLSTGRGVVQLVREGPTARFRHDGGSYWKRSNHVLTGRGCQCFCEGFYCTCGRWGLYRFYRVWKILSCGVLGLLKVSVSAMLATVRCSDIYCDIPTWVPRCRCYVSVTVEGYNRYGRDG